MSATPSTPQGMPPENSDALRERLNNTTAAYSRFVPREFLNLLGIEDIRKVELGQQVERKMTILFCDIRNFTALSETMSPQENFNFLNSYLVQMEPVITAHGGFIDKYIGDAIMALFPGSPDEALRCSQAMLRQLDDYNDGRQRAGYRPIRIGIGINTGIVILGTIGGAARMDGTVIGDAVNLAARLERLTKEYRVSVLISDYTLYSLDHPDDWAIRFLDRTQVRGKQGSHSVYEVFNNDHARPGRMPRSEPSSCSSRRSPATTSATSAPHASAWWITPPRFPRTARCMSTSNAAIPSPRTSARRARTPCHIGTKSIPMACPPSIPCIRTCCRHERPVQGCCTTTTWMPPGHCWTRSRAAALKDFESKTRLMSGIGLSLPRPARAPAPALFRVFRRTPARDRIARGRPHLPDFPRQALPHRLAGEPHRQRRPPFWSFPSQHGQFRCGLGSRSARGDLIDARNDF
jgi:class 3 adenylate cyclase